MEGEEGSTASPAEGRESGAARWVARWPWGWPPPMIWILPETESWRQLSASSQPSSTGLLEPRELPFPPPPPGHCLWSSVPAANHPGPPPWAPVRVLLPQRLRPDVEAVNQQSWWQDLDLEGFLARAMEAQRLRRAREAAAGGPALALSPTAKPAPQGPPCPPHPRPPHSSLMGPLAQPVPSTGTSCRCPFAAPLVTPARPQTEGRTEARSTTRWAAKLGSFQKTEPRAKLFPPRDLALGSTQLVCSPLGSERRAGLPGLGTWPSPGRRSPLTLATARLPRPQANFPSASAGSPAPPRPQAPPEQQSSSTEGDGGPAGRSPTSMRPVSGWKLRAGSSVVTRHWMAQPLMRMFSCRRPRSGRLRPSATWIWAWTRSTLRVREKTAAGGEREAGLRGVGGGPRTRARPPPTQTAARAFALGGNESTAAGEGQLKPRTYLLLHPPNAPPTPCPGGSLSFCLPKPSPGRAWV